MKTALLILLLLASTAYSQNRFELKDASKVVDVAIDVGICEGDLDHGNCGPVKVEFFRKRSTRVFQTIRLERTQMWDPVPKANITRLYDEQSVINFEDFNFDGQEDIAICDGTNGGYGGPSYSVYLYSPTAKRFVYSSSFTNMNEGGLGMFETDGGKRRNFVYTKSGCCWHQTQGFDVHRGKPRKVYEFTEAVGADERVEITTRNLINGKWRKRVRYAKASEYYKN